MLLKSLIYNFNLCIVADDMPGSRGISVIFTDELQDLCQTSKRQPCRTTRKYSARRVRGNTDNNRQCPGRDLITVDGNGNFAKCMFGTYHFQEFLLLNQQKCTSMFEPE